MNGRLELAHRIAFGRPPEPMSWSSATSNSSPAAGSREVWIAWCHLLIQANEFVVIE